MGAPPAAAPSSRVFSAIDPSWSAATPSPPNPTVWTFVPSPDSPNGSADAPPRIETAPYTGPECDAGAPSGPLYSMRTVLGAVNAARAVAVAAASVPPPGLPPCTDTSLVSPSEAPEPRAGSARLAPLPAPSIMAPPGPSERADAPA